MTYIYIILKTEKCYLQKLFETVVGNNIYEGFSTKTRTSTKSFFANHEQQYVYHVLFIPPVVQELYPNGASIVQRHDRSHDLIEEYEKWGTL